MSRKINLNKKVIMSNESKSSKWNIGLGIGLVAVCVILWFVYIAINFNINRQANNLSNKLPAQKTSVESKLDAMNKTLSDFVGITKAESDAFLEFQTIVASSKQGQTIGGMMTAIQEVYPNFDVEGFKKLYPTVEAQRKEFKDELDIYNDVVREYNTFISDPWNEMFIDVQKYPKAEHFVVSSTESKKSMETGIDNSTISFE